MYFELIGEKPTTVVSTYVNNLEDSRGNVLPFMELNHYQNKSNNGAEVFEFRFNFYTDVNMTTLRSYGAQIIGNEIYYYQGFDNESFSAINNIERGDPMLVSIDGELYSVTLNGVHREIVRERKGLTGWIVAYWGNVINGQKLINNDNYFHNVEKTYEYTMQDFFKAAKQHLGTTSNKYGKFELPLVEMSNFFEIKQYNSQTQQFNLISETSFDMNYFLVKAQVSRGGLNYAAQSIFKIVANDFEYNTGTVSEIDYWQHKITYIFTLEDFNKRYSDLHGGYLLTLKNEFAELAKNENYIFDITLSLKNSDNIKGFDRQAVKLTVQNLTIISDTEQSFYIFNNSINNDVNLNNVNIVVTWEV